MNIGSDDERMDDSLTFPGDDLTEIASLDLGVRRIGRNWLVTTITIKRCTCD